MALYTIDARHLIKRVTTTGSTPTIPPTNDFTDGTWAITDTRTGEFFFNAADNRLWIGNLTGFSEIDLVETGSTDFNFCSTGIATSSISGCSGGGSFTPISFYNNTKVFMAASSGLTLSSTIPLTSANGGGQIDLDVFGITDRLAITNDNGNFSKQYLLFDGSSNSIALASVGGIFEITNGNNGISSQNNNLALTNSPASSGQSLFINTQSSSINAGLTNTIVIGGTGISGSSSNTVYLPKLKLQPTTTLPNPEQGMIFFSGTPLNRIMYNTGGTSADWIII